MDEAGHSVDRTRAASTSCATRSVVEPLCQFGQARLQLGHGLFQLGQALLLRHDQRTNRRRGRSPIFCAQTGRNGFVAHAINLDQFPAGVYRQHGPLTPFA